MANEYVDPHPYYWAQASQLPTTIHGWGAGTELPAGLTGKSFAEVVHPFYREFPDIDADVSGGASITDLMTGAAGAGHIVFQKVLKVILILICLVLLQVRILQTIRKHSFLTKCYKL